MIAIITLLLIVGDTLAFTPQRFSLRENEGKYTPKHWKLIHRSVEVPKEALAPPMGVKPDDYFRFIPTYIGSAISGKPLTWKTDCFGNNSASLTVDGNRSAILSVSTTQKSGIFCSDAYLIAYVASFDLTYFEIPFWRHSITFEGGWSDPELFDLNTNGIRLFKFPDGVDGTAEEIFETILMFFGGLIGAHVPEYTAEDNLKFLQDHMDVVMPVRNITRVDISKDQVKSGDFLGIIRLDGLDPMLAWAMGAHTGHTTIAMWVDNELYVMESQTKSAYWPNDGVQMTPWDTWINLAEKANYNVVHLPLNPDIAKNFNAENAIKFFKTVQGMSYGFHAQFTGWIDTAEDNYPPPLSSHLVMLLLPFGEWFLFNELNLSSTVDFVVQGLNHRLGTQNLTLLDAYMYSQKVLNMTFTELITIPEMDSWNYLNKNGVVGPSMVCDVFVARMWKEGGIFGNLASEIQTTEFTNWDAYSLNIFDANYVRPKQCVDADPDSQFCQLLGKYRMSLPDYNSFAPYPHMREHCPSLPPKYIKPLGC